MSKIWSPYYNTEFTHKSHIMPNHPKLFNVSLSITIGPSPDLNKSIYLKIELTKFKKSDFRVNVKIIFNNNDIFKII